MIQKGDENSMPDEMSLRSRSFKVAVVQRTIPHYRVPFFEQLCAREPGFVVYHSTSVTRDGLVQATDFSFPSKRSQAWTVGRWLYQFHVLEILRSRFDVVVLGLELSILSNLAIWAVGSLLGKKIMWWGHGFNRFAKGRSLKSRIDRWLKSLLMDSCSGLILYTNHLLDEVKRFENKNCHIGIINNSIDEKAYYCAIQKVSALSINNVIFRTRDSTHTLVYVGRLLHEKCVDVLLKLSKLLLIRYPDLRVFLIGDGPEKARLEQMAIELNLGNHVFFLGTINDPEELSPYLVCSDVMVNPGYSGLSINLSFVHGIPFITLRSEYHAPEIAYLKNNKNGFIAENMEEMYDWIVGFFENPELRQSLREGCRAVIGGGVNMNNMVTRFILAVRRCAGDPVQGGAYPNDAIMNSTYNGQ
jgi:glycosyltransferase involved in cell wall biosynthesis